MAVDIDPFDVCF